MVMYATAVQTKTMQTMSPILSVPDICGITTWTSPRRASARASFSLVPLLSQSLKGSMDVAKRRFAALSDMAVPTSRPDP